MKLTVIVPIYNAEPYLPMCLKSIVGQAYQDMEIILIDDGSTDRSLLICREYQEKDDRIRVITQDNHGVVATRRKGIAVATGEYLTFVDADDYLEIDAYQQISEKMMDARPDIVLYDLIEESDNGKNVLRNQFSEGLYMKDEIAQIIYPSMLSTKPFFTFGIRPTVFSKWYRRDFLQNADISINDGVTLGEDVELTFQAILQANSLQIQHLSPYCYCKRVGSMTWDQRKEKDIITLKTDLETAFKKAGVWDVMEQQLREYITFIRLFKMPQSVDEIMTFFAETDKRIALYGAGGFGQSLHTVFGEKITLWVDKNYEAYKKAGLPVEAVDRLFDRQEDFDGVYIAIINKDICEMIYKQLIERGVNCDIAYFDRY